MKVKRYHLLHLILTAAVSVIVTLGLCLLVLRVAIGSEGFAVLEGIQIVRSRFVGEYDGQAVADAALSGVVEALGDRWSYYMTPEGYAAQKLRRANAYVGIGVTVTYEREDGLLIKAVTPGGGAEEAGLLEGEVILSVDGVSLTGEMQSKGADLIQGEAGTGVELEILAADGTTRSVTVMRRRIVTDPVTYEMLDDGMGYVRLANFYDTSASRLNAAVDDLLSQGAQAIIFDLRDNGGGYLAELTEMLDHLLPEGVIFRSETVHGRKEETRSDAQCVSVPMAVLVNAETYSAAEFFAAELKEWDAGVIVGDPTCGKGYSQQTYALTNGSAMNVSTAKYFTGSGISLIGKGLEIDKEISLTDEHYQLFKAGKLEHTDDEQLNAARKILEGKLH